MLRWKGGLVPLQDVQQNSIGYVSYVSFGKQRSRASHRMSHCRVHASLFLVCSISVSQFSEHFKLAKAQDVTADDASRASSRGISLKRNW